MRLHQDPQYSRIPAGGRTFLGPVQYWLATDHLLLVEVVGLVEKYRRFDLGQIEAITVRPTTYRIGRILAMAMPLAVFGTLGAFLLLSNEAGNDDRLAVRSVGGVAAAIALLSLGAMLRWLLLGPAYEVRLTTSLQSHCLPGLDTRPKAEVFCAAVLSAAQRVQAEKFPGSPEPSVATAPESPVAAPAAGARSAASTASTPSPREI